MPIEYAPARPVSRPPPMIGTARLVSLSMPMRRLKNGSGMSPGLPSAPLRISAERENALSFEEELPLLGKEQAEARQVHLLLVVFDLREVGVVGEIGDEARASRRPSCRSRCRRWPGWRTDRPLRDRS